MEAFFRPRLGIDLSTIRIHRDSEHATREGARAVARGEDIAFAPSQFSPGTTDGRRLIAHELVHVLQQRILGRTMALFEKDEIFSIVVNLATKRVTFYLKSGKRVSGTLTKTVLTEGEYTANANSGTNAASTPLTINKKSQSLLMTWSTDAKESAILKPLYAGVKGIKVRVISRAPSKSKGSSKKKTPPSTGPGSKPKGTKPKTTKPKTTKPKTNKSKPTKPKSTTPHTDSLLKKLAGKGPTLNAQQRAEIEKKVATLSDAERKDLETFAVEAGAEDGFDLDAVLDLYTGLTPEDREALRTNLALRHTVEETPDELPEEVKLAITQSADDNNKLESEAQNLNLKHLAEIHAKVNYPGVTQDDVEPIDVKKLRFFKEMMLLEGLLAGAAERSPEVQPIARRLTKAISEIRGWVLREIRDLAIELGVSAVFTALTGGTGAVATGGRVAWVIWRLNRLRKFVIKIESVYSTISSIRGKISTVTSAFSGFEKFQSEYRDKLQGYMAKMAEVNKALGDDALQAELDKAEDDLFTWILDAVQDDNKLGPLLDHLDLPAELSEEELLGILKDIPAGISAMKEVASFYGSVGRSDVAQITRLALKGARAGALLWPFVAMLADMVAEKLATLMTEPDLKTRLSGLLGGRRPKGKGKGKRKRDAKKKSFDSAVSNRKKQREKDRKDRKTRKSTIPKDAKGQWTAAKAAFNAMAAKYETTGARKKELKRDLAAIKRDHKLAVGKTQVRRFKDKAKKSYGEWEALMAKKKMMSGPAQRIKMTKVTRLREAGDEIRKLVQAIPASSRSVATIEAKVSDIHTRYHFDGPLKVEEVKEPKKHFLVKGAIGGGPEREITSVDDVTGLKTGKSKQSAIPIYFYKNPEDFYLKGGAKELKLTPPGSKTTTKYTMHSSGTVKLKIKGKADEDIRIGVAGKKVGKGKKYIQRSTVGSNVRRSGTKQRRYRKVLTDNGVDLTGYDADHVLDLGFSGADDYDNLWPLDSSTNRIPFIEKWYRKYMLEFLETSKATEVSLKPIQDLRGRWFEVIGIKRTPPSPGGRKP